jgi:hypothetical protein
MLREEEAADSSGERSRSVAHGDATPWGSRRVTWSAVASTIFLLDLRQLGEVRSNMERR